MSVKSRERIRELLPVLVAIGIFSTLSIAGAISSDGFLEADSCTHYLYARFALTYPHFLVNVWGRPVCTGIYMLPALFAGRLGVRLMSLALALICGFCAYAIAKGEGRTFQHSQECWNLDRRVPALALIFTLAQPLVFLHSFSELTELPFAAMLGIAFLAYQRRQILMMAILVSLLPLTRPEGFGFLALAAVALVAHRRAHWLIVLPIPLLAWDYVGWRMYGSVNYSDEFACHFPQSLRWLFWLKENWPYAAQSVYGHGNALKYLALMPAVVSPIIFPATCIGMWLSLRGKSDWRDHLDRCARLIAIIPLMILVGHSMLYCLGRLASSGEMRYMLIVAPFWGILSASGWTWVFDRFHWPAMFRLAGVAALVPAFVNFEIYMVVPITPSDDLRRSRVAADWYTHWPQQGDYPRLMASEVGVHYYLDICPTDRLRTREWLRSTIADAPRGTAIIWDPVFGFYNSDTKRSVRASDINAAGWVLDIPASLKINDTDEPEFLNEKCWLVWRSPQMQSGESTPVVTSLPRVAAKAYDEFPAK
jgi:hypothetical protein